MPAHASPPSVRTVPAVLVVLDGLADRRDPVGGALSHLERAATPHLDRLVAAGRLGDVVVVGPGVAPESDAGVFALLGYDPVHDSPGRGVLEALGVDIPLAPGDVALRLNFATAAGDGTIVDSRVGRSLTTAEARELAASLTSADLLADEGIRAEVRATVGHRGVLWFHPTQGAPLSPNVSNADPFYEKVGGMGQARRPADPRILPVEPTDADPASARTARAVNRFLERASPVLSGHRITARRAMAGRKLPNAILVRNAGALPATPPATFAARYGVRGAALTEMPVERGIARFLGLDDRFIGPMSGDRDPGYRERAAAVRELLGSAPFVYVHLKGPDEPGHDGDPALKQEIVEAIDRSFFGPLLDGLDLSTVRFAVTADHATPCSIRGHSDDPVPWLLVGAGVPPSAAEGATKFGESSAAVGPLGHHRGGDVLPTLLDRPLPSP